MSKRKVGNLKVKELVEYCGTKEYCKTCIFFKTIGKHEECNIGLLANYLDDRIEVDDNDKRRV